MRRKKESREGDEAVRLAARQRPEDESDYSENERVS